MYNVANRQQQGRCYCLVDLLVLLRTYNEPSGMKEATEKS